MSVKYFTETASTGDYMRHKTAKAAQARQSLLIYHICDADIYIVYIWNPVCHQCCVDCLQEALSCTRR